MDVYQRRKVNNGILLSDSETTSATIGKDGYAMSDNQFGKLVAMCGAVVLHG